MTRSAQTDSGRNRDRWWSRRLVAVSAVVAMVFGLAVPVAFASSAGAAIAPAAPATPAPASTSGSVPDTVFSFK
ncbi:MAG TPA: hypothetical protein VHU17_03905, partial [Acidimicrobiales bacterium]|nr:hypothetical protein [Acidimicrobiales bacterium]